MSNIQSKVATYQKTKDSVLAKYDDLSGFYNERLRMERVFQDAVHEKSEKVHLLGRQLSAATEGVAKHVAAVDKALRKACTDQQAVYTEITKANKAIKQAKKDLKSSKKKEDKKKLEQREKDLNSIDPEKVRAWANVEGDWLTTALQIFSSRYESALKSWQQQDAAIAQALK